MAGVRLADEAWGDVEAEALLSRWLVPDGTTVRQGQPVAEVVLVKTTLEVPSPVDGTLAILVPQDGTFARGQDIATVT